MKKRNILIPIDFSDEAIAGLTSGKHIAKQINADITLLHIVSEVSPESFSPSGDLMEKSKEHDESQYFMAKILAKKEKEIQALAKKYSDSDLKFHSVIRIGEFDDAIEEYAEKHKPDLIVMGTSGETSFEELFSGNHAAITVRETHVPVLTVKDETWISKDGKLLLLVDLINYKSKTIKSIKEFADLLNMKVLITHIKQNRDNFEDNIEGKLEDFAKEHGFTNYSIHSIGKGNKIELVKDLAGYEGIDLVASISEVDNKWLRLFTGSDTEKFINKVDKPILAMSE